MADYDWPSSVPGPELSSVRYRPAFDNHLRSGVGVGMKTRRRTTGVPEIMTCRLWMSASELQTLMDFYQVTVQETLAFNWSDFRKPNDTTVTVEYSFRSYPNHGHWTFDSFWVDLELNLLTTFQGTFPLDIEGLST